MMGMNDYRSQRTRRGDVDPKASKGRKIRYDVHEKLVSLMVPIQNELWTEEQKDELFGSLFGFGFEPNAPSTHHDQPFALAKADGFKLF
jgi:protein AATF/BFR2